MRITFEPGAYDAFAAVLNNGRNTSKSGAYNSPLRDLRVQVIDHVGDRLTGEVWACDGHTLVVGYDTPNGEETAHFDIEDIAEVKVL